MDFSRLPTQKERVKLQGRLDRLGRDGHVEQVQRVKELLPGRLPEKGLFIRNGFSCLQHEIDEDVSDRRAPARHLRPPATRLMNARGAALRFAITLLAIAQCQSKPGEVAHLQDLNYDITGDPRNTGWSDFIVTDAVDSKPGRDFLKTRDKRARSVRNAIDALVDAGLIFRSTATDPRKENGRFVLLNEEGTAAVGEREDYKVPRVVRRGENPFAMPSGLIMNDWLQVLEDSEIAVLLMVACGKRGWPEADFLVMPSDARLLHYGIHRDMFSSARKTLEWFGLLQVEEYQRLADGRAEDGELRVHRLALNGEGFSKPAVPTLKEALEGQLARNSPGRP